MNILIDTNIVLNIIRSKNTIDALQFINPHNNLVYISIVKSLALKNNWNEIRYNKLSWVLDNLIIVDITQEYINAYAEIDAFSQRTNPSLKNYPFSTPRNMGKNDLWIASTSALLGLKLITTDSDFDHLDGVFFEVEKLTTTDFLPFFKKLQ